MESRIARWTALAALVAMAVGTAANAAPAGATDKTGTANTFRASKLIGVHVKNAAGDKIGTVEDLVVNVGTGKIAYAAVGVGGVLGIGEKLFAVPFSAMVFQHSKDETAFILDTTKEKLEASPGFDKNNWPDFADPKWTEQVDHYYRQAHQARPAKVSLAK